MIMKIQHNHSAAIAYTYQTEQQRQMSKTVQKLASGFRINRAGDDAAGLAISEKMRGQIRGLHMAQKNASDGMSMLQVAEGALQETHTMLQRLRELSVQAANDTNTDEDRAMLQQEVTSLLAQIDKNAHDTQFNTQPLLNGHHLTDEKGYTLQVGANSGQQMNMKIAGEATLKGLGLGIETKIVEIPDGQVHQIDALISTTHKAAWNHVNNELKKLNEPHVSLSLYVRSSDGKIMIKEEIKVQHRNLGLNLY